MYRAATAYFLFFILVTFSFGVIDTAAQGKEIEQKEVEKLNQKAIELIAEKQFPEAIALLEKAIGRQPTYSAAHMNLGSAYLLSGQPNTALGHLKRGLELEPDCPYGNNQIAVIYNNLGKPDIAIDYLKKSVQIKPDYALGYFNLGAAYLLSNRLKPAAAALEKALKLEPANTEIKLYLGITYARQSRFAEAVKEVKFVTQKQPDDSYANLALCKIYLMANDRQSALDLYKTFKTANEPLANEMFRTIYIAIRSFGSRNSFEVRNRRRRRRNTRLG